LGVILVIAVTWLFLLVLALAILRTAGNAERDAERRLRAAEEPEPRRRAADAPRKVAHTALILVLPLAGLAAGAPDADARSCAGAHSAPRADASAVTLCLINAERRARGVSALGPNARLARAAQRHAADMVTRAYFSHVSPSGSSLADRLRRAGYARGCAWSGGETLAWGTGALRTPASRVAAWMRSPSHRAILLSPDYRDAGLAIVSGSPGSAQSGATYVGEFGRRRC
jgi:uncharacterized protein YkwD